MRYGDIAKVTTATLVDIAVNQGRNSAATDLTLVYFDEEG